MGLFWCLIDVLPCEWIAMGLMGGNQSKYLAISLLLVTAAPEEQRAFLLIDELRDQI